MLQGSCTRVLALPQKAKERGPTEHAQSFICSTIQRCYNSIFINKQKAA